MGRKIRCHLTVDDTSSFLQQTREYFVANGYDIECEDDSLLVLTTGNAVWTIVGTHQWNKTSRTVIASEEPDDEDGNIEILYDVSWLAINYRPEGKVREEVESFLTDIDESGNATYEYESQI